MKTIEQSFADWESHVFGYGYGSGEEHVIIALKKFFNAVPIDGNYDYKELETMLTPTVAWLLINVLCHAHMIEYGTSPRFAWLTKSGKAMQKFLASKTIEELLNNPDSEDHCSPDCCNCGPDGYQEGIHCTNPFWDK